MQFTLSDPHAVALMIMSCVPGSPRRVVDTPRSIGKYLILDTSDTLFTMPTDWSYPRRGLAQQFLTEFDDFGAKALTVFAGRGIGKTHFLQRDLAPLALANGRLPIYIDVWREREHPASGIADAFKGLVQELEGLNPKKRDLAELNISVLGFGGGIKAPRRPEPNEPRSDLSRIGFWAGRLSELAGQRKVMLMLDEVQALALHPEGSNIAAALRAAFNTNWQRFEPVFTGSHRDRLLMMFKNSKAPLFNYGSHQEFPPLDRQFSEFVAQRIFELKGVQIDAARLDATFEALGRKPAVLIDLAADMMRTNSYDLELVLAAALRNFALEHDHVSALRGLQPIDHAVLSVVAQERALFTEVTRTDIAAQLGIETVSKNSVQKSVGRLRDQNLVWQVERGVYRVSGDDLVEVVRDLVPNTPATKVTLDKPVRAPSATAVVQQRHGPTRRRRAKERPP